MFITTSDKATDVEHARAAELARVWGFTCVPRSKMPHDEPVLVVTKVGLQLRSGGTSRRWHDGMLHAMRSAGVQHPLIRLTGLQPGDTVLDCTLGLGTDARFLAEYTRTRVVGVEVVPALALMAEEGLAKVGADVDVRVGDALSVLRALPEGAFDLVLADPMFPKRPTDARLAPSLEHVRWAADHGVIGADWRDEALRVARKVVLVRDMVGNDLLERLEAPHTWSRRGRATRYGWWPLTG